MTQSVKRRIAATGIGAMSKYELVNLLLAVRSDLNSLNTVVGNLVSGVGNLNGSVANLVSDVTKISNNTNSANNTVQILGKVVAVNLNALTALNTST
jgi:DNA repair protein RadC